MGRYDFLLFADCTKSHKFNVTQTQVKLFFEKGELTGFVDSSHLKACKIHLLYKLCEIVSCYSKKYIVTLEIPVKFIGSTYINE